MILPFSAYTTLFYGIFALLLTASPYPVVRAAWFSNLAEYWGAVTAVYLLVQYLPTALFLHKCLKKFPACQFKQQPWDMGSSYVLFFALVLIPPLVMYGIMQKQMLHWQQVVWVTSLAAAFVDILISFGQHQIQSAIEAAQERAAIVVAHAPVLPTTTAPAARQQRQAPAAPVAAPAAHP